MNKKLIMLFMSSCFLKLSNAQNPSDALDHFSQIGYSPQIPASPEATSLGEFGQHDVNLCYGTPAIEIPLFSIQSGDLILPVSLAYNASGNKVKDEGSWIGLGWNLKNASMAVSRTVMGQVDEKSQDNLLNDSREWWNDGSINVWDDIYKFAFNGVRDTEPDLFSYNVPGYSGQFVIGYNRKIEMIPFQPVQIIPTFSSSSYGPATDLLMFIIVTPDGVSYTFNKAEYSTTEITNFGGTLETKPYSEYVSAWYITSIQKGSDNITFSYNGLGLRKHPFQTSETMTFKSQYNNYVGGGSSRVMSSFNTLNEWRLEKIIFKGGYADVSTSGIDVVINGKTIYDINFSVSLFPWRLDCTTETCRRNKLSFVSVNGNKHSFSYENIEQPPINCEDFDHWGFYNGANNNTKRVPYVTINGVVYGQGANRNLNQNYSKFGMLKRITYPTGGYTDFDYETNTYLELDNGGQARFEIEATDTYIKYGNNQTPQETNWPKSNIVIYDVDNAVDIDLVTWYPELVADIEYGTVLTSGNSDENMIPVQYIKNPTFQLNLNNSNIFLTNYNTYDYRYYESSSNQERRVTHLSTQINQGRNYTGSIFSGIASLLSSTNAANYVKAVVKRTGYILADPSEVSEMPIGGFRIHSISSYDNEDKLLIRKSYSYKSEVTGATSGVLLNGTKSDIMHLFPYYDTYSILWTGSCEEADQFTNKLVIHSRPTGKLSAGIPIGYSNVTEFLEDNLGNKIGRTVYRFSLTGDQYSGEYPKAPVISMGHYRGQLLEKKIYDEGDHILAHEVNVYSHGGTSDAVMGAVITKDRESFWGVLCVDFFDPSLRRYKATPYSYSEVSESRLIKRTTTDFFGINSVVTEENYSYSNDNKYELLKTKSTKREDEMIRTEFAYDYELSSDPICPSNIREERIYKNDRVIRARKINYASWDNPGDIYEWKELAPDPNFSKLEEGGLDDGYEFGDEYRVSDAHITYDLPGRVRTILTRDGKPTSYFYDSDNKLVVAVIDNCPNRSNAAFASFEPAVELHNLYLELTGTPGPAPTTFFTGLGSLNLAGYTLSSSYLEAGKYIVEFWANNIGITVKTNLSGVKTTIPISPTAYSPTWKHYRATVDISAGQSFEITGTGIIDEVRIYPVEARMTTFTHLPFIGILSSVDPNGVVSYFSYDSQKRVSKIEDQDKYVLKQFSYNFSHNKHFSITGSPLDFGANPVGAATQKTFSLTNTSSESFLISAMSFPTNYLGDFRVGSVDPGETMIVTVTFTPSGNGVYSGDIIIDTDAIGPKSIPVTGSGTAPTRIMGISGNLNFGTLMLSGTYSKTITISNTGNSPLVISGIALPAKYSANWTSATIAAASSKSLTVTFIPGGVGVFNGTMTISSNMTSGISQLSVSGEGSAHVNNE